MAVERVTIIGATGEEGFGLALRWAKAGIEVVVGSRAAERAEKAAERIRDAVAHAKVSGLENAEAAAASDIVVVTVPYSGQAVIYKAIADSIKPDAIVVDCTVPVAASVGGRSTHVLGVWQGSAAQQAAAIVPKGPKVTAAFHSLSAHALAELDRPLQGDVLVCGAKAAKPVLRELVEAIDGLRYVDAGPLEMARIVEPITALLIGINRRYGITDAGIRITGLPEQ